MPYPVEVLAWISGTLIAIGVIWSKGVVPVAGWVRRSVARVRQTFKLIDTLADIGEQFKPNGGYSLHDKITRIESQVLGVKEAQAATSLDVAEIKRQVENIITEELPIITALAEAIVTEQEHVAELAAPPEVG